MRRSVALVVTFIALLAFVPAASAADTVPSNTTDETSQPNKCNHVLAGAGSGPLIKTFIGQTFNANGAGSADDTLSLRWRLESPRADSTDNVADCLWVDNVNNGNVGQFDDGETLYRLESTNGAAGTPMTFVNGSLELVTTIPAPSQDAVVCNRATRSGSDTSGTYTDKSQYGPGSPAPCNTDDPGAQIPEVPLAVLLPLSALGAFALAAALRARRPRGAAA